MNARDLLRRTYEVALKVRLIREHEKARFAAEEELTERELLALEVISKFSPINESELARALGIQTSSLADLLGRLVTRGLLEKGRLESDQRQRMLKLTAKGRGFFEKIKRKTAARYWYLFQNCIEPRDFKRFMDLLEQMERNADREVNRVVFGRLPDDDELPIEQLLGLPGFVAHARNAGK